MNDVTVARMGRRGAHAEQRVHARHGVLRGFEEPRRLRDRRRGDRRGLAADRRFWDTEVAHRDVKPANLLVQCGRLQLVTCRPEVAPTWRQAVDLANMMLTLALQSDPDRVYARATAYLSPDEIAEAFACAEGMAVPTEPPPGSRRPAAHHGQVQGARAGPRPGLDPEVESAPIALVRELWGRSS